MPCRVFLRSTLLLAAFAGAVLFLSPAVSSQTPPSVTFQVEVNFVDIDAVVTDERGNFIGDLRREDFELLAATPDPLDFPVIGRCTEGEGVELLVDGRPVELAGWDHFRARD